MIKKIFIVFTLFLLPVADISTAYSTESSRDIVDKGARKPLQTASIAHTLIGAGAAITIQVLKYKADNAQTEVDKARVALDRDKFEAAQKKEHKQQQEEDKKNTAREQKEQELKQQQENNLKESTYKNSRGLYHFTSKAQAHQIKLYLNPYINERAVNYIDPFIRTQITAVTWDNNDNITDKFSIFYRYIFLSAPTQKLRDKRQKWSTQPIEDTARAPKKCTQNIISKEWQVIQTDLANSDKQNEHEKKLIYNDTPSYDIKPFPNMPFPNTSADFTNNYNNGTKFIKTQLSMTTWNGLIWNDAKRTHTDHIINKIFFLPRYLLVQSDSRTNNQIRRRFDGPKHLNYTQKKPTLYSALFGNIHQPPRYNNGFISLINQAAEEETILIDAKKCVQNLISKEWELEHDSVQNIHYNNPHKTASYSPFADNKNDDIIIPVDIKKPLINTRITFTSWNKASKAVDRFSIGLEVLNTNVLSQEAYLMSQINNTSASHLLPPDTPQDEAPEEGIFEPIFKTQPAFKTQITVITRNSNGDIIDKFAFPIRYSFIKSGGAWIKHSKIRIDPELERQNIQEQSNAVFFGAHRIKWEENEAAEGLSPMN